ncbi:hypothetical protein HYU11_04160 [Candidatus Woesearchaeota archaeon]|nr:hypothetical protein [Candidatus Woesearchaeota archaeon]
MNKNLIMIIVLGFLLIASAVQAYQLTSLKAKIEEGSIKIGGSAATNTGTGQSTNNINELPTMVGGC